MNTNEVIQYLEEYYRKHPNERRGQAYFNALYRVKPALADEIRGTAADPFYDNKRIADFFVAIALRLSE